MVDTFEVKHVQHTSLCFIHCPQKAEHYTALRNCSREWSGCKMVRCHHMKPTQTIYVHDYHSFHKLVMYLSQDQGLLNLSSGDKVRAKLCFIRTGLEGSEVKWCNILIPHLSCSWATRSGKHWRTNSRVSTQSWRSCSTSRGTGPCQMLYSDPGCATTMSIRLYRLTKHFMKRK